MPPLRQPPAARLLPVALLASLVISHQCAAQSLDARTAAGDAKAYFTAPLHWTERDWWRFAGALAVVGIAHEFDDDVRTHFASDSEAALSSNDSHDARDLLPAALLVTGAWIYAARSPGPARYGELGSMLEAGVFSVASTEILKLSLGRERPDETADVDNWFSGGDSFPSIHSSAAFAIGTVFAESGDDDVRWVRRVVGYGVGGVTAYARVHDNAHWLSDVVAGAALGFATAHFVMNRRESTAGHASIMLVPVEQGLMLSYSRPVQ